MVPQRRELVRKDKLARRVEPYKLRLSNSKQDPSLEAVHGRVLEDVAERVHFYWKDGLIYRSLMPHRGCQTRRPMKAEIVPIPLIAKLFQRIAIDLVGTLVNHVRGDLPATANYKDENHPLSSPD